MGWAFLAPMKASCTNLSKQLPGYWERLQKPLIKMEQQAVLSEEKLQAEVTTEIAQTATAEGKPEATRRTTKPAPPKATKEEGTIRASLGEMFKGMVGRFAAVAFNGTHILVVLVTVFFGVTFTLMNPRPIFGAMFSLLPAHHHDQALVILQRIGKFVPGWAGATLLGMATIGVLVFLLMWPIFGFMDARSSGVDRGRPGSCSLSGPAP